ncbi:MAG: DUF2341 domain-containing protein, partial [Bacteroidetes bacterium]|nr:DUF2341 domain-containing protein [Bacteroidota bacterium]
MRNILTFLLIVIVNMVSFAQQPCLQGWKYRLPVSIDNTNNAETLTDYQVSLLINTAVLISANKMDANGADIRFLSEDGTTLDHWIESGTLNSSQTKIWVKVSEILSFASSSIYMFYGSPSAATIESGDNTFDLFDDFEGGTLDTSKWNSTITGGQITISGGALTATAIGGSVDTTTITSVKTFTEPIMSEISVQNIAVNANDIYYLGQINNVEDGYAGTYEAVNFVTTMRLSNVTPTAGSQVLSNLNPGNTQQAIDVIGTW